MFCCNRIASHNENSGGSVGDQAHALCTRHMGNASIFTSHNALHKAWKPETPRVENLIQNILQFIFCITFASRSYCCTSEFKTAGLLLARGMGIWVIPMDLRLGTNGINSRHWTQTTPSLSSTMSCGFQKKASGKKMVLSSGDGSFACIWWSQDISTVVRSLREKSSPWLMLIWDSFHLEKEG